MPWTRGAGRPAISLALGLCLGAAPVARAEAPRQGGVLRAGMQTDPVGLDPHTTNSTATRNLLENVYDTLVAVDSGGAVVPALARAWGVSADGLIWRFALREGVLFHDGQPLRPADVVCSLRHIMDRDGRIGSPRAEDLAPVREVVAEGDSVVLRLARPYAPLLSKLAFSLNAILPCRVAEQGDPQREVVGTGPFRFVAYAPQRHLLLARHPGHWGRDEAGRPLPYLDGIRFLFYPDPAARTLALRAGQVDFIEYVPAADVRILSREPGVVVQGGVSGNYRGLLLNLRVPPLGDVRVRQALALALDRQAIVTLALFGAGGVPAQGAGLPAEHPFALPQGGDGRTPGRDIERARRLLREAGLAGGFSLVLSVTGTYDFLRAPAEVIQANLREIGVRARIRVMDWSLFLPAMLEGRFEMALFGNSGLLDPDDFLYESFHSAGSHNPGGFRDAEVDALLTRGRAATDLAERRAIYHQAQRRILELAPQIFLFHSAQHEAYRAEVRGYRHYSNTSYLGLRTTWLSAPARPP